MKYDFTFKLNAVEMYRAGKWIDTPEGIGQKNFRKRIVQWSKIADIYGLDQLRHPTTCKERSAEYRYKLVARVLAGESQKSVAISAGIDSGLLSKWVHIYKINSAATLTGISFWSVFERLRTKFTLVVRSKHFFRFFF